MTAPQGKYERWDDAEEARRHDRLLEAIKLSACEYCEAGAYEPCVTHTGKECASAHIARLHEAHALLVDIGLPCRASALGILQPHGGHRREQWNKRKAGR